MNHEEKRKQIESSGTVIDDAGVACDGCLFGIKFAEMCVVDPDGDGPFHYNCALAIFGDSTRIRIAPSEFAIIDVEEFEEWGTKVEPKKEN